MSREKFSKKSPGDRLTDGFVNRLSKAVQRVAGGRSGSYGMHHEGDSIESHSAFPPWQQRSVIVVSTDEAPADEDGLYLVSPRWYSHRDKEWKTNEDVKWLLDARDSDMSFSEEETLVAYWDAQRGAWVPVSSNNLACFELRTDLMPGGSATAYRLEEVEVSATLTTKESNQKLILTLPDSQNIDDVLAARIADADIPQYVDVRWQHEGESKWVIGLRFAGWCRATEWDSVTRQLIVETRYSSGSWSFEDVPDPATLESDLTMHVFFWNHQRRADPEVEALVRDRTEYAAARGLSASDYAAKNGDRVWAEKDGEVWYVLQGPVLGTPHNVVVTNGTCQAGEIIDMKSAYDSGATLRYWPEPPMYDSWLVMPERAFACDLYSPGVTPKYAEWAVALKDCSGGQVPAVIGGLALAKLSPRRVDELPAGYDERWYADIHPDPDPEERDSVRLACRSHGRARIIRLIKCLDAADNETTYGLIDMNQSKFENVLLVAKDTYTSGTRQYFDCYGTSMTGLPMRDEVLRVYIDAGWSSRVVVCLGQDTVDTAGAGRATRFIASYHPGWQLWLLQRAEKASIPVIFQAKYDLALPAAVSVKFASASGASWVGVGSAFGATAYSPIGFGGADITLPNASNATINVAEGDIGSLCLTQDGQAYTHGVNRKPVIDATPFLDAPLGTIRMTTAAGTAPPGWEDYVAAKDRFVIAAGDSHTAGQTGTLNAGSSAGKDWICERFLRRVAK